MVRWKQAAGSQSALTQTDHAFNYAQLQAIIYFKKVSCIKIYLTVAIKGCDTKTCWFLLTVQYNSSLDQLNCCFRHLRGLIFFPIRNFTAQVSKIRKEPVNNSRFMIVTVWHYKGQLICSLSLKHKHLAYLCLPWPELWAVTKATFSTVVTASQPSFAPVFPPQLLNMWSFLSFLFSSPLLWESLKFDKLRKSQRLCTLFRWICWMLMTRIRPFSH